MNDKQLLISALNQLEHLVVIHSLVKFDDQVDIDLQAKTVKTFSSYIENVRRVAGLCVTGCDDDCEAPCHEAHQVPFKRTHNVEECENEQIQRTG